jgi:hypothetical protein
MKDDDDDEDAYGAVDRRNDWRNRNTQRKPVLVSCMSSAYGDLQ